MEIDFNEIRDSIEQDDIILLMSRSENLDRAKFQLLEEFVDDNGKSVIYVTITKPYRSITEILEEKDIDTGEMFFIDCMSSTEVDEDAVRAENCVYIDPQNLTNISIAVSEAVENLPDDNEKLLIFDTLSALRMYNDDQPLAQFAHFLTNKIRDWQIKAVLLNLEEEIDEEVTAQVAQCCDCQIHLED